MAMQEAKEPTPDTHAAVDFLGKVYPEGPWCLTSIGIDKTGVQTRTFVPETLDDMRRWIEGYNGQRNLYWHVNPVMRMLEKKATREHIRSMNWLHVDIDARAGEGLTGELERCHALLTTNLPEGVPEPTWAIFSGGGFQAGWKLIEPVPINGEVGKYEDAKLYNLQLELTFRADNCHNVDRILRIPGTINLPDAKKRKRGRKTELARLIFYEPEREYPIDRFTKAPALQETPGIIDGGKIVTEEVGQVQDLEELDKYHVPNETKVIIVQGEHPDKSKKGDGSRSAWVFDFCCRMARLSDPKVPDDVIFSILLDSRWGISESVLEQSNPKRYAMRQIQRAREFVIDPYLAYFNKEYAVIKEYGGCVRVISEKKDPALDRILLIKRTLSEFEKAYENKFIEVGIDNSGNMKTKPAGTWWRKHPLRRQYDTITFAPDRDVSEKCYNLWQGFAVKSLPGDCPLFLDHVLENVCSGNIDHYQYLTYWLARMVQTPGQQGEVAIVLRGGKGVGKSFFAKIVGHLFGRHYMQVSNSSHLVGNFNSHLRDLIFLFADEAFYAGDKKHESVLKMLITEDNISIEQKGIDVETAPNFIHLVMASNDLHVIPTSGDERRFFVLDVSNRKQKNTDYFGSIYRQMESGGYEALLHYLRSLDISDFEVRDVPVTTALQEQKLLSLSPDEEWWIRKLEHGQLLEHTEGWPREVMARELMNDYLDYTQRQHVMKRSSETSIGKFLHRIVPKVRHFRRRGPVAFLHEGEIKRQVMRTAFYEISALQLCRTQWVKLHGKHTWPSEEDEGKPEIEEEELPF